MVNALSDACAQSQVSILRAVQGFQFNRLARIKLIEMQMVNARLMLILLAA